MLYNDKYMVLILNVVEYTTVISVIIIQLITLIVKYIKQTITFLI